MKYGLMALFLFFSPVCQSKSWYPKDSVSAAREQVSHLAYSLNYDHDHKNARWVAYELTPERLVNCAQRDNQRFVVDLKLREPSAAPDDYRQTGYDRGHLVPAGDMKWSEEVMRQSFFTSNITPQTSSMNRGRWSMLETLIRAWALESEQTLIITGPVLSDELDKLPSTEISIPDYHYKVLLSRKKNKWRAIGFLMDQAPQGHKLEAFVFPVREIEKITGINFFPHLSTSESRQLEENVEMTLWDFKAKFQYLPCPQSQVQSSMMN
jgi:endonuclease G